MLVERAARKRQAAMPARLQTLLFVTAVAAATGGGCRNDERLAGARGRRAFRVILGALTDGDGFISVHSGPAGQAALDFEFSGIHAGADEIIRNAFDPRFGEVLV